jgi:WD40 repeat protein
VAIWKLGGGNPIRLRGHSGSIYGLAFSPDGATLAGAGDQTICLWRTSSGKLIRRLAVRLPSGRPRDGTSARYRDTMTSVVWSPDGSVMVCGGLNNTILLWDAATWRYRMLR